MTSSKPYILRAIYDWVVDNKNQPYVVVDATQPDVVVPEDYIDNGHIVLNIAPDAVYDLKLGNDQISFQASFASVVYMIHFPVSAVLGIFSHETGHGLRFDAAPFPGEEGGDGGEGGITAFAEDSELELQVGTASDADEGSEGESGASEGSSGDSAHPFLRIVDDEQ